MSNLTFELRDGTSDQWIVVDKEYYYGDIDITEQIFSTSVECPDLSINTLHTITKFIEGYSK